MSILHFVFSNSLAQCMRRKNQLIGAWGRQLLLVIHNCLINGLANIYVHNNLEIFVVYPKEKMRKRSLGYEEASYKPPNERRQTLIRQLIVDFIILIENLECDHTQHAVAGQEILDALEAAADVT